MGEVHDSTPQACRDPFSSAPLQLGLGCVPVCPAKAVLQCLMLDGPACPAAALLHRLMLIILVCPTEALLFACLIGPPATLQESFCGASWATPSCRE